jgi:hypothetical protein
MLANFLGVLPILISPLQAPFLMLQIFLSLLNFITACEICTTIFSNLEMNEEKLKEVM